MIQQLRKAGFQWPGITRDVTRYVKSCPQCQLKKDRLKHIHAKGYHLSSGTPGEHIGVDSITNLPPDKNGFMHILVIVDLFSRWSQLYPLKTLTADESATALLHYVTTFGTPSNITSDNGTQFINDTVKDLSALLDIIPIPIVPYNHQENGIVENRNRYIRRLLEASQPGKEKDYQLACALTTRALNSREHSTLGLAPADIQFGMHNRLDKNLFPMELSDQREPNSWVTHYYDVIKKQDEMLGNSRVSLARAQQRHARTLKPPQPNPFNKGDWILVENDSHQSLKTGDDKRDGPFKVLSTTDDSIRITHVPRTYLHCTAS
jgi:hypothetical protein